MSKARFLKRIKQKLSIERPIQAYNRIKRIRFVQTIEEKKRQKEGNVENFSERLS